MSPAASRIDPDVELAASLPEPLRVLLSVVALLGIILPLCIAFGGLLGALLVRRRRHEHAVVFAGTLVATFIAPFVLLGATRAGGWAFGPLLVLGIGLPGVACWWLGRRYRR